MAKYLIKNGRVWDGHRFMQADVLTDGMQIAAIRPEITEEANFVFDATGKIVTAGLVDLHVHLKGIAPVQWGAPADMSSLPFGVTAVNDAGSSLGDKAFLDALTVKSTVFVSAKVEDNHVDFALTEERLARYGDRAIGLKLYFDTSGGQSRDITPLREVCDYARSKGLMVMVHCSGSPTPMVDIVDTLAPGDVLTHVFHGGDNTCVDNDFAALRLAKEKGVVLDAGFAAQSHTDFGNFRDAVAAGFLPDTISTDLTCTSVYRRGGYYGLPMCMSMAKEVGMSEEQIMAAVTSAPAKALGKADSWGCLKEGGIADIAVLEYAEEAFSLTDRRGNVLESDMGYRCVLTLADGFLVYRR